MQAVSGVSERRSCRVLQVSRAALHRRSRGEAPPPRLSPLLAARLRELLTQHPTFGYRRLWALLRYREGLQVNRKVVYRILKLNGWLVHQRPCTPRPRVRGWQSQTAASNQRWAMDVTHIPCGADGWAHLATVIDCHDREVIGYEFACVAEPRRRSGRSRRPACTDLARCGPRGPCRSCGVTMG